MSVCICSMWKVQNETTTVRLFLSKMILHSGYEDTFFSKNSDSCRNIKKFFSLWNPPWSWRLKFSFHNDPFKLAVDLFHLLNHFIILWIRRSWDFLNFCRLIVIFENSISEERIVSKEETSIFKFVEDFITFYQIFEGKAFSLSYLLRKRCKIIFEKKKNNKLTVVKVSWKLHALKWIQVKKIWKYSTMYEKLYHFIWKIEIDCKTQSSYAAKRLRYYMFSQKLCNFCLKRISVQ